MSGESGCNTPRENVWTTAKSMPTWQQSIKGKSCQIGSASAKQVNSYDDE